MHGKDGVTDVWGKVTLGGRVATSASAQDVNKRSFRGRRSNLMGGLTTGVCGLLDGKPKDIDQPFHQILWNQQNRVRNPIAGMQFGSRGKSNGSNCLKLCCDDCGGAN